MANMVGVQYCVEDVVRLLDGDHALVTRSWLDEQTPEQLEGVAHHGLVPLAAGQFEIRRATGEVETVTVGQATLVDRGFIEGDLVRALSGGPAGIVKSVIKQVQLQRALTLVALEGWHDVKDKVMGAEIFMSGDHVIFGNWVGVIEDCCHRAILETRGGGKIAVCDAASVSYLSVGSRADAFAQEGRPDADQPSRVVDVQQLCVAVNWLAFSQLLPMDQQDLPRPQRLFTGIDEISQLAVVRCTASHINAVGDKVIFRDRANHPLPASESPGGHVLFITSTRSFVTVMLQDGSLLENVSSVTLTHIDGILDEDVDVFPGEIGMCTVRSPPEVAIVQSMNYLQRTLKIRYYQNEEQIKRGDPVEEELISGLEFDPNGAQPAEQSGVGRHDRVLISKDKTGATLPMVATLGESEHWVGTFPNHQALRESMFNAVQPLLEVLSHSPAYALLPTPPSQLDSIKWYGEVVDLELDGRARVRFPGGTEEIISLEYLYSLDDGLDSMEEHQHEQAMLGDDAMSDGSWELDPAGQDAGDSAGNQGEEGEAVEGDMQWESSVDGEEDDGAHDVSRGWADEDGSAGGSDDDISPEVLEATVTEVHEIILPVLPAVPEAVPTLAVEEELENWRSFVTLDQAPEDHHYFKEAIITPARGFMSRMQKEYRVLASSLPHNILVRVYADRSDLMRVLIIGPAGTPFAYAPFLFDVFLSPSTFPAEPPKVFFHNWGGGTRISPNLYTEGKVCLSLLNTWPGEKSESWSSARSSILQIFVSIGSLVIVEEPYYTEPGFEKQPSSEAASAMYNERTYALSQLFVKRACEYPSSGFEVELRSYYLTGLRPTEQGKLHSIVAYAKLLLEESQVHYASNVGASGRGAESSIWVGQKILSPGACLLLQRTLISLEKLLAP